MPLFSTILIPLAKLYGTLACLGLDDEEVASNRASVERVRELIAGGMDKDEAVRLVLSGRGGGGTMTSLLRFLDDDHKGRWANIKMGDGAPCWIGIAQTGVLVKRSKIGLLGAKLYDEKDLYRAADKAMALTEAFPNDLTPAEMWNPVLKAFTNAVLHCSSIEDVKRTLNTTTSG